MEEMTTVSNGWRSFDAIHVSMWKGYEIAYIWDRLVMTEPLNCEICADGTGIVLQIIKGDEKAEGEVGAFLAGLLTRN